MPHHRIREFTSADLAYPDGTAPAARGAAWGLSLPVTIALLASGQYISTAPAMIMAVLSPAGLPQRGRRPRERACRVGRDTNSSCFGATMHGKSLRGRGGAEQPGWMLKLS
jgi:hypothetical protein